MPERVRTALICFCIAALCGVVALVTDPDPPARGESSTSYDIHGPAAGGAVVMAVIGLVVLLLWLAKDVRGRD